MDATYLRAANGQFVAQDFVTRYPTGRRHCACCKRWRHVTDFSPAKWADKAKTIILKLLSYCHACVAEKQRQRTGHQRRTACDGQVGTEAWRQRRLEKKRARYRAQRQNPFFVQARRDYVNQRTRQAAYAKWGYVESEPDPMLSDEATGGESFNAQNFVAYLDSWKTRQLVSDDNGNHQLAYFINGRQVTDNEGRQMRRWRSGENKRVNLGRADAWAIRFDLPFWEIEEVALAA